jgi:hypothetical protein
VIAFFIVSFIPIRYFVVLGSKSLLPYLLLYSYKKIQPRKYLL